MRFKAIKAIMILTVLLVVCCGSSIAYSGSKDIPAHSDRGVNYDLAQDDTLVIDLHSSGPEVDIYILDESNHQKFLNDMPSTAIDSQQSIRDLDSYTFTAPKSGRYHLNIVNKNDLPVTVDIDTWVKSASDYGTQPKKSPRRTLPQQQESR